jgi:hypothetical protein
MTYQPTTHLKLRLARAGSGTKLHVMSSRSQDGGQTYRTHAGLVCGSSMYDGRGVVEGEPSEGDYNYGEALDNLATAAVAKRLDPAQMCRKCAAGVAARMVTITREAERQAAAEEDARVIAAATDPFASVTAYREREIAKAGAVELVQHFALEHERAAVAADVARRKLIDTVVEAHRLGASEYQLAEAVGVQRSTIRAWLGK